MRNKSISLNVKILAELKLKRSSDFWLIYESIAHNGGSYWRHVATIHFINRESNKALYERAQIAMREVY